MIIMEDDEFDEKINKLLEKYGGLNAGLLGGFLLGRVGWGCKQASCIEVFKLFVQD